MYVKQTQLRCARALQISLVLSALKYRHVQTLGLDLEFNMATFSYKLVVYLCIISTSIEDGPPTQTTITYKSSSVVEIVANLCTKLIARNSGKAYCNKIKEQLHQ